MSPIAEEVTRVLSKLKADKRIPEFQGLQIGTSGAVHVVYKHGCVPFRSVEDFIVWAEAVPTQEDEGPKTKDQELRSEENPS